MRFTFVGDTLATFDFVNVSKYLPILSNRVSHACQTISKVLEDMCAVLERGVKTKSR